MKRTVIRTLKIIAVLIPVLVLVVLDPANASDERNRIRDFYREEPNTLDVVVLGASEVFADYSAALAYGEFGFTSYPYCMSSNRMDLYPSQLAEIYASQDPELVVIEITPGMYTEPSDTMDATFRNYIGRVPLSVNKIRTVWDFGDRSQWLSYMLPFLMYHNTADLDTVLTTVSDELFLYSQSDSLLKGNFTSTVRDFSGQLLEVEGDKKSPLAPYTEQILRTFLDHCREQGYDNLLFVTFPHRVTTEYAYHRSLQTRSAGELIESYGYSYINLEPASGEIGLDPVQDYYNDDHMNLYGQEKFTKYFGSILAEAYGIGPSKLSEKTRERWDRSLDYTKRLYVHFDRLYREKPEEPAWLWENKWLIQELENMGPVG